MFTAWLYSGEVPFSSEIFVEEVVQRLMAAFSEGEARWHDTDLVKLWIFASRHDIYDLMNAAVSCLAMQNDERGHTTSRAAVKEAFEEYNGKRNHLKSFLVHEAVYRLGTTNVPHGTEKYAAAYIARIFEAVMAATAVTKSRKRSKTCALWQENPCRYHIHHSEMAECRSFWKSPPARKDRPEFAGQIDGTTVTILVGEKHIPFIVHKDLICYHSDYFGGLFNGKFAESGSGAVKLLNENPVIFRTYVDWLYCQEVHWSNAELRAITEQYLGVGPLPTESSEPASKELGQAIDAEDEAIDDAQDEEDEDDPEDAVNESQASQSEQEDDRVKNIVSGAAMFSSLAPTLAQPLQETKMEHPLPLTDAARVNQRQSDLLDLYILADRRDTRMLRNAVVDEIIGLRQKRWPYMSANHELANKAYEWLPDRSKLCDYLTEEAAFCWSKRSRCFDILRRSSVSFPNTFLSRVAWRLFDVSAKDNQRLPRWCSEVCKHYHEHNGDEAERTRCRSTLAAWQEELRNGPFDSQHSAIRRFVKEAQLLQRKWLSTTTTRSLRPNLDNATLRVSLYRAYQLSRLGGVGCVVCTAISRWAAFTYFCVPGKARRLRGDDHGNLHDATSYTRIARLSRSCTRCTLSLADGQQPYDRTFTKMADPPRGSNGQMQVSTSARRAAIARSTPAEDDVSVRTILTRTSCQHPRSAALEQMSSFAGAMDCVVSQSASMVPRNLVPVIQTELDSLLHSAVVGDFSDHLTLQ